MIHWAWLLLIFPASFLSFIMGVIIAHGMQIEVILAPAGKETVEDRT